MQVDDDRATFLLPRHTWVNDSDVAYCSSCNNAFGHLNRRHHCRNCGNIFCHDCSNRKVPLPQLGYGTRPERVCNGCFDVAYLVTYAIDEDHGVSTQTHGVRGLLELAEKGDEKDLHNMVAYGGVDAIIWLLRSSKNTKIHHLSTTILAMLAERESIRPVLITKWALAALLNIIRNYTTLETTKARLNIKKSPTNSIHSTNTPSLSSNPSSESTTNVIESPQLVILEIIMNSTHVVYQLSRAGILSQKEVFTDGVFSTLLILASFNMQNLRLESLFAEGSASITNAVEDENDQQFLDNVIIIQALAAKSMSAISSLIPFQSSIIELIQSTKSLPGLLRSSNQDVEKYLAKTIAYLSLRNDKYKPLLLSGDGAPALLSIIVKLPQKLVTSMNDETRFKDLAYYLSQNINAIKNDVSIKGRVEEQVFNSAAVSNACCALANFATNNESQRILSSQPHLLQYICNVPLVFGTHNEIHRHVARCLANLALYKENNEAMLHSDKKYGKKDGYNVVPTLLLIGQTSKPDIQRQIVRAIDNLSNNLSTHSQKSGQWKELFGDTYTYITKFLEENDNSDADVDTYKRAKNIVAREKLESVNLDNAEKVNATREYEEELVDKEKFDNSDNKPDKSVEESDTSELVKVDHTGSVADETVETDNTNNVLDEISETYNTANASSESVDINHTRNVPEETAETDITNDVPEEMAETDITNNVPEEMAETNTTNNVPEEMAETDITNNVPEETIETYDTVNVSSESLEIDNTDSVANERAETYMIDEAQEIDNPTFVIDTITISDSTSNDEGKDSDHPAHSTEEDTDRKAQKKSKNKRRSKKHN